MSCVTVGTAVGKGRKVKKRGGDKTGGGGRVGKCHLAFGQVNKELNRFSGIRPESEVNESILISNKYRALNMHYCF
jgi:hypothetical protein